MTGYSTSPRPHYQQRAWYVAALSTELEGEALLSRRLLGTSVLLYRDRAGAVVALRDRCPHRFAPLSMGTRQGDDVVCPYHGLRFDAGGHCVHNPHGRGQLPKGPVVRRFPLVERHGFAWIWMAEEPADESLLPDFAPLDDGPATGVGHTYMKLPVDYRMILDNVMDLSHVDYVHGEIITTRGQLSPLIPAVSEADGAVAASWEYSQTPPIGIFAPFLPRPEDAARHFIRVTWTAPANIQLWIAATQEDGGAFEDGISQYDLHSCTPGEPGETHYFFATRRNHAVEDAGYNAFKTAAMHAAFEDEDGPIIAAAEREMEGEDFFALKPMLLSNDLAAVKVRRRIQALVEAERAGGAMLEAAE